MTSTPLVNASDPEGVRREEWATNRCPEVPANSEGEETTVKLILKRLRTVDELYENQLQMLLSTEEQLVPLLLDMQQWAADDQLRAMLQDFHDETERQVPRIRELVTANVTETNMDTKPIRCKVMAAMSAETEDMMADAADPAIRDMVLITAAQRIKHYEIAVYGTIRTFANLLGKHQNAEMLESVLQEEKEADRILTAIAERINAQAPESVPRRQLDTKSGVGKLSDI